MIDFINEYGGQIFVERFTSEPTVVDGVITAGASKMLSDIYGIIQQTTGRQTRNLTDSQRKTSSVWIATMERLYPSMMRSKKGLSKLTYNGECVTFEGSPVLSLGDTENTIPKAADIVHIEGERYEVVITKKGEGVDHYESIAVLVEE